MWQDIICPDGLSPDYEMDDEFMPEVNDSNLFVLERASDLASIATITEDGENDADEENSDEVPSELLLPDTIPEIDDENNSTDYENDDLMPSTSMLHLSSSKSNALLDLEKVCSSQTFANNNSNIEFKKRHFKRGSSLSEDTSSTPSSASLSGSSADSLSDESLSVLKFPDYTSVDGHHLRSKDHTNNGNKNFQELIGQIATENVFTNSSKMFPSLMTGLLKGVLGATANRLPSTSTSDSSGYGSFFVEESNKTGGLSTSYLPTDKSIAEHLQNSFKEQSSKKLEIATPSSVIPDIEESSDESEFEIVQNEDFR